MKTAMDGASARTALEVYIDGELAAGERGAFERHLEECAACRQAVAAERVLKAAIRALPRHAPPAQLAERIRGALPKPAPARAARRWSRAVPPLAAAIALFLLGGVVGRWAPVPGPHDLAAGNLAARDVVAAHVRALVSERVTDVASSDRHTVKPWFNGRVEIAPPVEDLTAEGFPLVGGRLDYIEGRRAATLVYRRRQHLISLFVWPSASQPSGPAAAQGYNLLYWSTAGMSFAAISDLNRQELEGFSDIVRARAAPPEGRQ